MQVERRRLSPPYVEGLVNTPKDRTGSRIGPKHKKAKMTEMISSTMLIAYTALHAL